MSTELVPKLGEALLPPLESGEVTPSRAGAGLTLPSAGIPAAPWRDPQTIPPEQRAALIQSLEKACLEHPQCVDFRTGLAMAYALNYDAYKAMDALEAALELDPNNFFAQFKTAELWYRLRALPQAEEESRKALDLASNQAEYHMARAQLKQIRDLSKNSWHRPTWNKPVLPAGIGVAAVSAFILLVWRML